MFDVGLTFMEHAACFIERSLLSGSLLEVPRGLHFLAGGFDSSTSLQELETRQLECVLGARSRSLISRSCVSRYFSFRKVALLDTRYQLQLERRLHFLLPARLCLGAGGSWEPFSAKDGCGVGGLLRRGGDRHL